MVAIIAVFWTAGSAQAVLVVRDPTPAEEIDFLPADEIIRAQAQVGNSFGPSTPGGSKEGIITGGLSSSTFDFQVQEAIAHPFVLAISPTGSATLTYGSVTSGAVQALLPGNALKLEVFSAFDVEQIANLTITNGNGDVYALPPISEFGPNGLTVKVITGPDFDSTGLQLSGTVTTIGASTSIFGPRGSDARVTATLFTTATPFPEPSTLGFIALAVLGMARRART